VLDGLFVTPAVTAITEALASARAEGTLAVVGNARLATALAAGHEVIPVALSARAARKLPRAIADLATVEPASLAAVIATGAAVISTGLATDGDWEATIRGWARVVRDGGAIVFVDRGHPHEASRRALCGGLTEIEQRRAGRAVITSGLVSHLAPGTWHLAPGTWHLA
jgi:hypothetical protein